MTSMSSSLSHGPSDLTLSRTAGPAAAATTDTAVAGTVEPGTGGGGEPSQGPQQAAGVKRKRTREVTPIDLPTPPPSGSRRKQPMRRSKSTR